MSKVLEIKYGTHNNNTGKIGIEESREDSTLKS